MNQNKLNLPSKKSVEDAIKRIDDFRTLCQFQMEVGYRSTIDFPSKHHMNKILQMQYRDKRDLIGIYGNGLVEKIFKMMPYCKSYIVFLRDADEQDKVRKKPQD